MFGHFFLKWNILTRPQKLQLRSTNTERLALGGWLALINFIKSKRLALASHLPTVIWLAYIKYFSNETIVFMVLKLQGGEHSEKYIRDLGPRRAVVARWLPSDCWLTAR